MKKKEESEAKKRDTEVEDIPEEAEEFKDLEILRKIPDDEKHKKEVNYSKTEIKTIGVNLEEDEIKVLKLP